MNTKTGTQPTKVDVAISPARKGDEADSKDNCQPISAMSMKDIYNANNLFDGYMKSRQGVEWKEGVQSYEANLLLNLLHMQSNLKKWLL